MCVVDAVLTPCSTVQVFQDNVLSLLQALTTLLSLQQFNARRSGWSVQ